MEGPVPFPGQVRAFIACERASPALSSRRLVIGGEALAALERGFPTT